MEHTQEQKQQGKITPLFENLILQRSVEVEGHTRPHIEGHVEILTMQEEHIKPQMADTKI